MKAIANAFVPAALVLLLSCSAAAQQGGVLSKQTFPFAPVPVASKLQLSCRSLGSLSVNGALSFGTNPKILEASIDSGTDRLSVRISADHLVFLSSASFGTGSAEGERFPLIENTADYLKAFESRSVGVALLESFVLNKHTGLAIWTKIQAKGLLVEVPESQTIYFACV